MFLNFMHVAACTNAGPQTPSGIRCAALLHCTSTDTCKFGHKKQTEQIS